MRWGRSGWCVDGSGSVDAPAGFCDSGNGLLASSVFTGDSWIFGFVGVIFLAKGGVSDGEALSADSAAADAVHSSTSYSKAAPSGSFSSSHVSVA